jgi:hypothetical protein
LSFWRDGKYGVFLLIRNCHYGMAAMRSVHSSEP